MLKYWGHLIYRWLTPVVDPFKLIYAPPKYIHFFIDWDRYSRINGAERIRIRDTYPQLYDNTQNTSFDAHCFYQNVWAFKKIYESKVNYHVDVGSHRDFVGFLSTITKITFIDIRPLVVTLENFNSKKGNVLSMPLGDNSVPSLSCLSVAEHIGLGRYGDLLDPFGTKHACKELSRVLSPNGNLYFSVPVGKARLCFNAHRIHSPQQIIEYFSDLQLVELSGVDDNGHFIGNIDVSILENSDFAFGLFQFRKNNCTSLESDASLRSG